MGRRGPAPKPTALKAAQGNPGKRTLRDNEPVPPLGDAMPPAWLTDNARKVWTQIAPIVKAMKTLTTADTQPFARYCETFARWIDLNRQRAGKRGARKADVWLWAEERKLNKDLLIFEREFGLTAAARTRIQVEMGAGAAAASEQPAGDSFRDKYLGPIPFRKPA